MANFNASFATLFPGFQAGHNLDSDNDRDRARNVRAVTGDPRESVEVPRAAGRSATVRSKPDSAEPQAPSREPGSR